MRFWGWYDLAKGYLRDCYYRRLVLDLFCKWWGGVGLIFVVVGLQFTALTLVLGALDVGI